METLYELDDKTLRKIFKLPPALRVEDMRRDEQLEMRNSKVDLQRDEQAEVLAVQVQRDERVQELQELNDDVVGFDLI